MLNSLQAQLRAIRFGRSGANARAFIMEIRAFGLDNGATIPRRYTDDGENVYPQVQWTGVPEQAHELVLLVDDPDAPRDKPFVHWIAFHIPPATGNLPEGVPRKDRLERPTGMAQGRNDFGTIGYLGP